MRVKIIGYDPKKEKHIIARNVAAERAKKDEPIAIEILADSIVEIAAAMKRINESRLTREALITLIADKARVGKSTVSVVLDNLDSIETNFLKKRKQ